MQPLGWAVGCRVSGSALAWAACAAVIALVATIESSTYDRRASASSLSPPIGLYASGDCTRPASRADSARVSCAGGLPKYRWLAAAIPYAPEPK